MVFHALIRTAIGALTDTTRAALLELLADHRGGRDVRGVGDRGVVSPGTPVGADDLPGTANDHAAQVGGDVDEPADHPGVDGVVISRDAYVVVPAQPDPGGVPDRRSDRW